MGPVEQCLVEPTRNVSSGPKFSFDLTVAIGGTAAASQQRSAFLLWGKNLLWADEAEEQFMAHNPRSYRDYHIIQVCARGDDQGEAVPALQPGHAAWFEPESHQPLPGRVPTQLLRNPAPLIYPPIFG